MKPKFFALGLEVKRIRVDRRNQLLASGHVSSLKCLPLDFYCQILVQTSIEDSSARLGSALAADWSFLLPDLSRKNFNVISTSGVL
jgi:hypothetical protein